MSTSKKSPKLSPVAKLQESINLAIELQAKNLKLITEGEIPGIAIDGKVWDSVLKMVEIMPKLELFERIANGATVTEAVKAQKEEDQPDPTSNAFEERSKVIKARINGGIDTKKT